jgi:hypothetical protein|tara:strand:- start:155 stop:340 length:186 start_codon:yes stop_codon:yes gene_type:complete
LGEAMANLNQNQSMIGNLVVQMNQNIKELEMQYRAEEDESIKERIDQQMTMIKKTLRKLEG